MPSNDTDLYDSIRAFNSFNEFKNNSFKSEILSFNDVLPFDFWIQSSKSGYWNSFLISERNESQWKIENHEILHKDSISFIFKISYAKNDLVEDDEAFNTVKSSNFNLGRYSDKELTDEFIDRNLEKVKKADSVIITGFADGHQIINPIMYEGDFNDQLDISFYDFDSGIEESKSFILGDTLNNSDLALLRAYGFYLRLKGEKNKEKILLGIRTTTRRAKDNFRFVSVLLKNQEEQPSNK